MQQTHGFELLREQDLPEINSAGRLYRHAKTGAELLSLVNDDENKVFGIAFRTPPADSTGIAHILEHSVLCGSRKYPVKDPFVQLMKGSLNTFLNAITYPDKTIYPVASQNLQDFYNLVDVYLDAVFYPRIGPYVLQQEGWHYELTAPDAPLTYKGVVYNEMKGNYSSPDGMLAEWSQRSLFPDTAYGFDSGGDPKHIPELTYSAFKSFHERFYHPSNARILFYGDDEADERLRRLDAYLGAFERIEVSSGVALQPRFHAPRRVTRTFAASGSGTRNAMMTVNWMFDEVAATETALALRILRHVLVGTPASPLRKALIDSGLGGGVTGGDLVGDLRQPMFSIGLKDIDPADAGKVEELALATLAGLARNGIDPLTLDASLNTVEFKLRENNTGSLPRGIAVMTRALADWLYGRDPLAPLAFEAPLGAIKSRVAAGERYFEELIGRCFVANAHRTTVLLQPDPQQEEREEAEERARLAAARAAMSEADLAAVIENTRMLQRLQGTPDTAEALASIPTLTRADLPRRSKTIPLATSVLRDTKVLHHDLFTAGIVYLDLGFDLHTLPAELLPYVGVFSRALLQTGAGDRDFVAMSQRIGRATGGIRPQIWGGGTRHSKTAAAWLILRAKAMPEQSGELFDILRDLLLEARLDDRERVRQIALQEKASLESSLVPRGSFFASTRLQAGLNEAGWFNEQTAGISQLAFLRKLVGDIESDWPAVAAALERIRATLVNRAAMLCNVTTDAANRRRLEPQLAAFLDALPLSPAQPVRWPSAQPVSEGLIIPALVNYVAKGANLYALGYSSTGSTAVVERYLGASWLWDKVRVQGGAYGGSCSFNRWSGDFIFSSYRDPNLLATIGIYDGSAGFLRSMELSDVELTRAIIGAIGEIDDYQLPDAKGLTSMAYHLIGETDETLQCRREEVLATNAADFRAFADALDGVAEHGHVVVLGSEQALRAASAERPDWLRVSNVL
jgi:Zn-dependent M16 (insulinase) family peptidase